MAVMAKKFVITGEVEMLNFITNTSLGWLIV
jgi:hypothetical protein